MALLILIGYKKDRPTSAEHLFCGEDGQLLEQAAEKAAKTEEYSRICKIVSPSLIPMPIDPRPTVASGKPKTLERKPVTPPKSQPAPKHIQDAEDKLAKQRAIRLKPTEKQETKKAGPPKKTETPEQSQPAPKQEETPVPVAPETAAKPITTTET